jgi:ribosomal protein S18 acetylase RimI-like enzyme
MHIRLEPYDPERHDAETIATLIFDAEPDTMALGFGPHDKAVKIIARLMAMENNHYAAENITCAQHDDETVGIIVGFTGDKMRHYEKESGQDYFRSFGLWHMLKVLPRASTLQKIVTTDVADDEYCVFSLSVAPAYRSQGIGSTLLRSALEQHPKLCLDVSIDNEAAQRFYERHGLVRDGENTVMYKGRRIGNYCMRTA